MKNILVTLSMMFFVFSCAKKNPNYAENSLKELILQQESLSASSSLKKDIEVKASNLQLIYPNDSLTGKIILTGDDAQIIYKSLQIIVTEDPTDSVRRLIKEGRNILCLFSTDIQNDLQYYKCQIEFQYEEGEILLLNEFVEIDEKSLHFQGDYQGNNVQISSSSEFESKIILKENTATILYELLKSPVKHLANGVKVKRGRHYTCRKESSFINHIQTVCFLNYSSISGTVLDND